MSAAFETLPPDQRAVLQLILKQGRGYAELAGLLKIDASAVRARAHAGLDTLAPNGAGAALTPARRGQIADYLLGQLPDAEEADARRHLEDSRAARRWAGALRERLAPLAAAPLPEVPAAGVQEPAPSAPWIEASHPEPSEAEARAAQEPDVEARAAQEPEVDAPAADRHAASAREFAWDAPPRTSGRRASRLGGALLLGGVAVLLAVLAIVLLTGGDEEPARQAVGAATRTQPLTTSTSAAGTTEPTLLQQVNLRPPGGGERPLGIAFIMFQDARVVAAIQAEGMVANGQRDVYTAWLRNRRDGRVRFLGYVPELVGADGRFTVSSTLPDDADRFDQLVVSRDPITDAAPRRPAEIVLLGTVAVKRTTG